MTSPIEFEKVREVAIAMTAALGLDPFKKRPATGYDDAPIIEAWEINAEWAARFLAAYEIVTKWSVK